MKNTIFKSIVTALLVFVLAAGSLALAGCTSKSGDAGGEAITNEAASSEPEKDATKSDDYTFTDLAGRTISLAAPATRALAIAGPSYEKTFMLGQADKLTGVHFYMLGRPWVIATNPNIAQLLPIESPGEPNVEALLGMKPDAALFFDYEDSLKAISDAGIPVVVVQQSENNPKTVKEFIDYQKKEVQVFADTFGGDAHARAEEWFSYFDEKVAYIQEKLKDLPESERKTALYAYGEEGLGVFSQYSYVSFWLELAGGRNLADETGQEMDTTITPEQIFAWDPDFYFMGRMETTEPIATDAKWAGLKAVKDDHVVICPDGVMYWDYSSEGVLLMQFLAQKMYPELFSDLDMAKETQAYYKKFYGYELSSENAQRLLEHLPPA